MCDDAEHGSTTGIRPTASADGATSRRGFLHSGAGILAAGAAALPGAAAGPALVQISVAKVACGRCPVQPNCLSYALVTGQNDGIWGGTTSEERWPARHPRSGPPAEPARLR